ncbi:MAG: phosphoserine phosphatase RsbU/P [Acidobacteriaceae bacterium]|nr:phosphoserine phosphatase RsbU/P [Acidobacteriaceae bacterium]
MSLNDDVMHPPGRELIASNLPDRQKKIPLLAPLRKDVASIGPSWLPVALVLGAIAAVAYVDHRVVSTSLVYLYIFPLGISAILLRKEVTYSLVPLCILLHDYWSPRVIHLPVRIFDNLFALLCFWFVVYLIQRYIEQRELLAETIQKQRDDLLRDVELAAQVQRMFLPVGTPVIAGLEIAGMMRPFKSVGGDYYDYIPINANTIQIAIGDVSGKGVSAALLMSATAAAMRLEANRDRNMLQQVERLNTEIGAVSDPERYVTLLVAEIDTDKRRIRYVNCGHNSALLFQAKTRTLKRLESSCPPIGLNPVEFCELASAELTSGDVLVFYTDGVTEAENLLAEEFGMERLSAVVQRGSSLSAEGLMDDIFSSAASFSKEVGFGDDVTILVVKCNFNGLPA